MLVFFRRPPGRSGLTWIGSHHVQQLLRTLANPGTPVTHDTLNRLSPWRSVAYLRDLPMHHGVLPPAERHLMLFQRWLGDALVGIDRPEHRQMVQRFAAWHVQRRLRREPDVPKDWGGEQFDLWTTSRLSVEGQPLRAAFAFKGPAKFGPMTIATLGKNGDQIDRLAQTAADLMVVQHCHSRTAPVVNMLKTYASNPEP